jgi:transposase
MAPEYDNLMTPSTSEHQDPLSGNLFAFINRRATQIRVRYFDRSGLCVWSRQ